MRSPNAAIQRKGWDARNEGKHWSECPYSRRFCNWSKRLHWIRGWIGCDVGEKRPRIARPYNDYQRYHDMI